MPPRPLGSVLDGPPLRRKRACASRALGYFLCRMTTDYKRGGRDLAIGTVLMDSPAVLAPLSGVTDVVFRRIARRFGAGLVVTEMVASDELVRGSAEALVRAEGEGVEPHVVQLAGRDPRWMAEAARIAQNSGAAIVDINMGCP